MTLKEKFEDVEWVNEDSGILHGIESEKGLEQCEAIANNFAIGFAEWKDNNCVYYDGWNIRVPLGDEYSDFYTNEELLKIYKKEK